MGKKPFWYLRRRSVKSDVDEELALHIEMRIDELVATGVSRDDAMREALKQFGDLERTRRYCREQDERREDVIERTLLLQDFVEDVRVGVRSLLRAPRVDADDHCDRRPWRRSQRRRSSAPSTPRCCARFRTRDPDRLVRLYTDAPPFKFRFSIADYLALDRSSRPTSTSWHLYRSRRSASATASRAELIAHARGVVGVLLAAGRHTVAWPRFHRSRRPAGSRRRSSRVRPFWQQPAWRAHRRHRQADSSGWRRLHDRRRAAGIWPVRSNAGRTCSSSSSSRRRRARARSSIRSSRRLRPGADPATAANELRTINRAMFSIWNRPTRTMTPRGAWRT